MRRAGLAPALLLALVVPGAAGAVTAADFAAVDSAIVAEMAATGTPGAAVAIVLGDSVVHARGFGVASVETGEPVTPATLFRVASTTKMLVAAALSALAERGRVDFAAPVSTYAPGLDPAIGRLTLHQLLAHTAGLADESSYDGPHDEAALGAFVRAWGAERFFTEPGRVHSYANPGYVLAGHVLAEAADTTFDAALTELLFRPLGMERSTTLPTAAMTWPHAQAHDPGAGGVRVVRPFPDDARFRPNGGVFTSAEEFARFARAFVNDGRIAGRPALPAAVFARLARTHGRRAGGGPADSSRIAYGLVERAWRGERILQHGGSRLGSGSVVRLAPGLRFAVVLLTNRTGSFLPRALERITALALGPAASPAAAAKPPAPARWARGEQGGLAGTWVNHPRDLVLELRVEKGRLLLRRPGDAEAVEVTKRGPGHYAFGGQEIEAIPGPDGGVLYLHVAGRAFARRTLPGGPAGE